MEFIEKLNKNAAVLEKATEKDIAAAIKQANIAYHDNDEPIISDELYDLMKEKLEEISPDHPILKEVGIGSDEEKNPNDKVKKVDLPYYLPSLDKIKPDGKSLEKWKDKFPGSVVVSSKLDGVSAIYSIYYDSKGKMKNYLYSRGGGNKGTDWSDHLDKMEMYDKKVAPSKPKPIVVRGELIIPVSVFESKYKDKYYKNGRNMVPGLLNSKNPNPEFLKDIHFVAYEVLESTPKPPEKQFEIMRSYGFRLPIHSVLHPAEITEQKLSALFESTRANETYECDGIVVTSNISYKRVTEKLPDYSFAFKMIVQSQIAESTILGIKWKVSKCGYIKPTLMIKPVIIAGAKIQNITGNNAAFVTTQKLGIGAKILVIRSGDVIPKVHEVVEPSINIPLPEMSYKWNNTQVDLVLESHSGETDEQDEECIISKLVFYFKTLEVKNFSIGLITKLVKMGYNTFGKIIHIQLEELQKVVGTKMAQKIFEQFEIIIASPDLNKLIVGSGCLGRGVGSRKLKALIEGYPNIFSNTDDTKTRVQKIVAIKGFDTKTAELIASNLDSCKSEIMTVFPNIFQKAAAPQAKATTATTATSPATQGDKYKDRYILFSGVRNKDLEKTLVDQGAIIEGSFTKKVNMLIVKDKDSTSSKVEKAKAMGIEIKAIDEF